MARFVGVADADSLIFVRGTTEGMNLVATAWGRANVSAGDRVKIRNGTYPDVTLTTPGTSDNWIVYEPGATATV